MIVTGLDIEATGLDQTNDRPIEVGMVLWTTNFNRGLESHQLLIQPGNVPVTEEITEITHLTQGMVDNFSYGPREVLEEVISMVERSQAVVAFNGRRFDIPMFQAWAKREGLEWPNKLVIDPFDGDLPAKSNAISPGMRPQELITMCAKEGIYYDAHEALADVQGMLKLMSKRPIEMVLQRAESPTVIIQSQQGRNENNKAKKHKFRWNPDKHIWWKAVKQIDLEYLTKKVNNEFPLRERPDLNIADLDTND